MLDQVNEVQEVVSRSYAVPDEVNEEDLQAGEPFDLKDYPKFTKNYMQSWMHFHPLMLRRLRISMKSSHSQYTSTWNYSNKMESYVFAMGVVLSWSLSATLCRCL